MGISDSFCKNNKVSVKWGQLPVQIAKRSELHKFAVIPKRWVVERSFS